MDSIDSEMLADSDERPQDRKLLNQNLWTDRLGQPYRRRHRSSPSLFSAPFFGFPAGMAGKHVAGQMSGWLDPGRCSVRSPTQEDAEPDVHLADWLQEGCVRQRAAVDGFKLGTRQAAAFVASNELRAVATPTRITISPPSSKTWTCSPSRP
jgi:hypothetical protein